MNILICDDIPEEAQKLEEAINAAGFKGNLVCFNRGADALGCILSGAKIDVCFLDVLMPNMDGDYSCPGNTQDALYRRDCFSYYNEGIRH